MLVDQESGLDCVKPVRTIALGIALIIMTGCGASEMAEMKSAPSDMAAQHDITSEEPERSEFDLAKSQPDDDWGGEANAADQPFDEIQERATEEEAAFAMEEPAMAKMVIAPPAEPAATDSRRFASAARRSRMPKPAAVASPDFAPSIASTSVPDAVATSASNAATENASDFSPSGTDASRRLADENLPADAGSVAHVEDAASINSGKFASANRLKAGGDQKKKRTQVEVFYATDRQHTAALAAGDVGKIFRWPLRFLGLTLLVGTVGLLRQSTFWRLSGTALLTTTLVLGYGGLIEWQQRQRLADQDDVRYTHDIRIVSQTAPGEPQSLDYGICHVNIPPDHQKGVVDAPSITRFEFVEDPDKHVVLERIMRGDQSSFVSDLNERLDSGNGHALVFIHGYNVSFDDAVKRTAQISFDVKFKGTPVCYSWPSHGGLEDYTRDMANADWSVLHLQEFMSLLFEQTHAKKIHVVAHSMGNRVLMQALDRLALQKTAPRKFGHIVLAAPDVSVNDFRHRYANVIQDMAQQVTLYASSRDRALLVSAGVHGHNRAGLAGDGIVVVDGIDTIDVSHIDTSYIGHSYYGDNPELIEDLKAIIGRSETTSQRSWLERVDTAANRFYWKFR